MGIWNTRSGSWSSTIGPHPFSPLIFPIVPSKQGGEIKPDHVAVSHLATLRCRLKDLILPSLRGPASSLPNQWTLTRFLWYKRPFLCLLRTLLWTHISTCLGPIVLTSCILFGFLPYELCVAVRVVPYSARLKEHVTRRELNEPDPHLFLY